MMHSTHRESQLTEDIPAGAGAASMVRQAPRDGQSAAAPPRNGLLSLACALGRTVRDTLHVTLDALRGGYDH
jgi:hypothetical protein